MALETIVRPYQTPDYAPGAREIEPGFAESAAPVRLRPGLIGKPKICHVHFSSNTSVYAIRRPRETQT